MESALEPGQHRAYSRREHIVIAAIGPPAQPDCGNRSSSLTLTAVSPGNLASGTLVSTISATPTPASPHSRGFTQKWSASD